MKRTSTIKSALIIVCIVLLTVFSTGAAMAVAPNAPSGSAQFKSDGTTAITQGGTTDETSVRIKATVIDTDSDNVQIQVEIVGNASSFTNTPNCNSSFVTSSSIATASCTGLSVGTSYKWQIRTNDGTGTSTWQQYGGTNPDVSVTSNRLMHNSDNLGNAIYSSVSTPWGVSGGKYGEFICETCHTSSGGTTNIKMIKQSITAPNGTDTWPSGSTTTGTITFTQANGTTSDMGDTSATGGWTGVCNVCHDNANHAHYSYNSSDGHNTGVDCTSCHMHSNAFKGSCTTCHGQPPVDSGTMVAIPGTTGSATAGAHNTHVATKSYNCDTCHYNNINAGVHNDGGSRDISIGFKPAGALPQGGNYDGQSSVIYDALTTNPVTTVSAGNSKTCTVYCHSTGQSTTDGSVATPTYASPVWDSTVTCGDCHKVTEASGLTSGSHGAHLGTAGVSGCGNCHTDAANDASSYNSANHVNASVDVANSYSAGGAPGNGYGTCSTASCHEDGRTNPVTSPIWGTTVTGCSECHATQPATGSHSTHLGAAGANCGNCHNDTVQGTTAPTGDHLDTNIDVKDSTDGDLGYTANKAKGSPFTTCSTASCHANVYGTGTVTTPVWGVSTGCTSCHSEAMSTYGPNTGSHSVHNNPTCTNCHNAGTTQTTAPSTAHRDGDIDITNGYPANVAKHVAGTYSGTCSTASCHDNGTGLTPTLVTTPVWGTSSACSECHAAAPSTGSHSAHLNAASGGVAGATNAVCGNCHHDAVQGTTPPTGDHRDSNIDVYDVSPGDLGYTEDKSRGSVYETCSTASCHDNGTGTIVSTPIWGTSVTNCSECHATQPATGSHSAHLSASVKVNGSSIACADCHNDAVQGTTAPTGDHLDGNIDVKDSTNGDLGYTANKTKNTVYESCSTASCHTNGQDDGGLGITQKTTATWGTVSGCRNCHDFNGSDQNVTGSHTAHITRTGGSCVECHNVYDDGTSQPDLNSPVHINGTINVVPGGTYSVGGAVSFSYNGSDTNSGNHAPGLGYGTCSSVSCHGGGATRHWGVSGDACNACHSNKGGPTVNIIVYPSGNDYGHSKHVKSAYVGTISGGDYGNSPSGWYRWSNIGGSLDVGCGYCHPQSDATHNNTVKNVNLDPNDTGAAGTVKAKNGAGWSFNSGVCSQVYCHSDGAGTYKTSPEWTAGAFVGDKCSNCHDNSPSTSSHGKHVVGIHYLGIYTGTTGLSTAGTGTANSHGNAASSSTINCNVCHNSTVTASANDKNTVCLTCHNGTDATLKGNMVIAAGSTTHVNGTADVAFGAINVISKAQVRDNITAVTDIAESWSRTSGYKASGSFDNANNALNTVRMFNSATKTCATVACHNGNSVKWGDTGISCNNCHTGMPK